MPALKLRGAAYSAMALRGASRTSNQSRERHRATNALVVVQEVALAMVLLVELRTR